MRELKVTVNEYGIGKALRVLYPNLKVNEFANEWQKLVRYSKMYPKESRDVRAAMVHHKDNIGDLNNPNYIRLLNYVKELEKKYGNRSITLRTLINAVSACERSVEAVQQEYRSSNSLPPAYDSSKRHPLSNKEGKSGEKGCKIRKKVINWISDNIEKDICLKQMSELFDPKSGTINKIQKGRRHFATLRNGSNTPIRLNGNKVLDIESMCFIPTNENPKRFIELINYYNIENYSDYDDHYYLDWNPSRIQNCHGVHTVVSDKDGKSREVYYTTVVRAVIGKAIMDQLDNQLRKIPGFYTYDQKRMILRITRKGWNKTKIIITIDMEKFSDTIVRRYMFDVITALGLPSIIAMQWDDLLNVCIYDEIKNTVLGYNDVVLQGQYTVFMLMSCLNLCIQRYINYKYNKHYDPDYSGVLGDDTVMVFDGGDLSVIQSDIENLYGAFGMKINILKSDAMVLGNGQGQFAKEDFDKLGIIHKLNPKNVENQNVDGVISDIIDLNRTEEQTCDMLTQLFHDRRIADSIIDYHSLNGGLYNGPIRKQDINIFKNNLNRIQIILTGKVRTDEERILDKLVTHYNDLDLDLSDSPLIMFLSNDQINQLGSVQRKQSSNEDIIRATNEFIITVILSMDKIGTNIEFPLLDELEGKYLEDLKVNYEQYIKDNRYHNRDVDLYLNIIQFDKFMAKRKMGIKGRYSSIFKPCITGEINTLKDIVLDRSLISSITDIEGRDQYWSSLSYEMRMRLIRVLESLGYTVFYRYYGKNKCCWISGSVRELKGARHRYMVHRCESDYYKPVCSDLPSFFKKQLLDDLQNVGIRLTMERIRNILMSF